ncbi:MAG: NfeD family protein [Bacteroidales bacterium]|nr:NfeD family protein [Bacteroidales bacterium]
MTWPLILIVLLVGLALIALEIIMLPGGVAGIFGGIMVAVSIWQTYARYGVVAGNIVLVSSLVIEIVLLLVLLKKGTWKRLALKEQIDSRTHEVNKNEVKVGMRGKSITMLKPAGNAMIGNTLTEVHSMGGWIAADTVIEVIDVEGGKITVKAAESDNNEQIK